MPALMGGFVHLTAHWWRVFATGLAFVGAGLLSLFLAAVAAPLRLSPRGHERVQLRVQYAIHRLARLYFGWLRLMGLLRLDCSDTSKLRRSGILVVANHPTLLDAWALMSQMPQSDCVVKESYYENFFLGGAARAAGFIPTQEGPKLVDECAARLRRGRSLIIFAEGTRSPRNALGPFARGAAHIALRAGCDPVPVTIECDPATLYRGQAWWDVPERTPTLSLKVGDALPVKEVVDSEMSRGRAARVLTDHLREYFERQLSRV